MKESLPPVHIGPVLQGEMTQEFEELQEVVQQKEIHTIISARGGGALLPCILGALPVLYQHGVIGQEPWGMVGTSTGSIATLCAKSIGLEPTIDWHWKLRPIAQFDGVVIPWFKHLTRSGMGRGAFRTLNFEEYYHTYLAPSVQSDYPDNTRVNPYAKPSMTGVVVTRKDGLEPYIYHDKHWEDEEGNFDVRQMIQCVERSCSLPGIFSSTQDPHVGSIVDGGYNRYHLASPAKLAHKLLGQEGDRVISIEPAANDLEPGIDISWENEVQIVRIVMQRQRNIGNRVSNIFVFNPETYFMGTQWGERAVEEINLQR